MLILKKKYSHKLYNEEMKKDYMKVKNSNAMSYFFRHSSELEFSNNTDLAQFDRELLEKLFLFNYEIKTYDDYNSKISTFKTYLQWALNKKYIHKSNITFAEIEEMRKREYSSYFIKIPYITDKDLDEIEERCVNFQDKLIFRLIFEGLTEEEITNIKKSDLEKIDLTLKVLRVEDENGKMRDVKLSIKAVNIIKKASSEETRISSYVRKNSDEIVNRIRDLIDSPYVLRLSSGKNSKGNNLSNYMSFNDRFKKVFKSYHFQGINDKFLNLNKHYLRKSGMLFYAKLLMDKDGKKNITKEYLKKISEKFNEEFKKLKNESFLHISNIEKLYGDRIIKSDYDINEWWKVNEARGKQGENLVKLYYQMKFGENNAIKVPDISGYDLEVETENNIERIEVKTLCNKETIFFITRNEIETMLRYSSEYYIHLIRLDESNPNKARVRIIEHPAEFLELDVGMASTSIVRNGINIIPNTFKVKIDDNKLLQLKKYLINI